MCLIFSLPRDDDLDAIRAALRKRAEEQGSGPTESKSMKQPQDRCWGVGKGVCLPVYITAPNNHNTDIDKESSRSNREVLHERKEKKNKPRVQPHAE